MRQLHRAGEKLFVDFAGMKIPIHDDRSDKVVLHAELFVAVAGASSYLYAFTSSFSRCPRVSPVSMLNHADEEEREPTGLDVGADAARKTGHGARLPMTAEVGRVLAEYLQHARPETTAR